MAAKVTSSGEYACNLLQLIFNATNYQYFADNTAIAPLTNLYVSLHTTSPTATGLQTSNEANYVGYTRVAVPRTTDGWTVIANAVMPTATIIFPQATGGNETETYFGVGTTPSGSGATVTFTQSGGAINAVTATPPVGGSGYPASATITLQVTSGGGTDGLVSATTSPLGVVSSYSTTPLVGGTGYSNATATTGTGTAHLLYFGGISPTIVVANGVQPELKTGSVISET